MAPPQLSEDEIDDLIYFARAGDEAELQETLSAVVRRTESTTLAVLAAAKNEGKNTSLHMAAGNGHLSIVRYLLEEIKEGPTAERQAFVDDVNEYGNTALHWAAMNGHLTVVQELVDCGAAPALANDKNYVPLDLASFNDKVDVVDYFLRSSGVREAENGKGASTDDIARGLAEVGLDKSADA